MRAVDILLRFKTAYQEREKMNPYETLEVEKTATDEQIKKRYREKAKGAHPDAGGDPDEFREIAKAYDILSNPGKRDRYDRTGNAESPNATASYQIAVELFLKILEHDPPNIEAQLKHVMAEIYKKIDGEIAEIRKGIKTLRGYKKRILQAPKGDFIGFFIDGDIRARENSIAGKEETKADYKRAEELLREYTFSANIDTSMQMLRAWADLTGATYTDATSAS